MISEFQRFKNNIEAIEQIILLPKNELKYNELSSLYSGMGSFPFFTLPIGQILTEKFDTKQTKRYFDEIRGLIERLENKGVERDSLQSAFQKIARSGLYAFYTDRNIVDSITENLLREKAILINQSGRSNPFSILEPSAGTGVFVQSFIDNIEKLKQEKVIDDNAFFKVVAIEPETISYRILNSLKNNLPENFELETHCNRFENLQISPDRRFDIISSNIPFGKTKIYDEVVKQHYGFDKEPAIHNYFFLKSSLILKDRGDIAFITSSNFLDSPAAKNVRKLVFNDQTEMRSIIRLPKETFKGTEVQTDYIHIRKKKNLSQSHKIDNEQLQNSLSLSAIDLGLADHNNPNKNKEDLYNINSFVFDNKEKIVLGEFQSNFMHGRYMLSSTAPQDEISKLFIDKNLRNLKIEERNVDVGKVQETIATPPKNVVPEGGIQLSLFDFEVESETFNENVDKVITISQNVLQEKAVLRDHIISVQDLVDQEVNHYTGGYISFMGSAYILEDYDHVKAEYKATALDFAPKDISLLHLKNEFLWFQKAQKEKNSDIIDKHRNFIESYQKFKDEHGSITDSIMFIKDDQYALEFSALEIRNKLGEVTPSDILLDPDFFVTQSAKVSTPEQALIKCLQDHNGAVKIKYICSLLGKETPSERVEVAKELIDSDKIFNDYQVIDGKVQYKFSTREEFISGNIPEKIEILKAAIAQGKTFDYISEAKLRSDLNILMQHDIRLQAFEDVTININSEWIDKKYLEDFLKKKFDYIGNNEFFAFTKLNGFTITSSFFKDCYGLRSISVQGAKKRYSGATILEDIINDKGFNFTTKIKIGEQEITIKDVKANKDAQLQAKKLKSEWKSYLKSLPEHEKDNILKSYNAVFCSDVPRTYDGSYLDFSSVKGIDKPHQHQSDAVSMVLQNDGGIIDHKVGAGKSLVMFSSAMFMKTSGLKRKPLLACTKATAEQIYKEFKFHFPEAKVFFDLSEIAEDSKKLNSEELRKKKYSVIANNDWDCVIMTHEEVAKIPVPLETQIEYSREYLEDLRDNFYFKSALKNEGLTSGELKRLEVRIESEEQKLEQMFTDLNSKKTKTMLDFNDLGIDHMLIDEAHKFKNMPFTTIHTGIAGLNTQPSERAKHFTMLTRAMRTKYNLKDKGVTVLSGTFVSNSMSEIYTLMNWIAPSKLEELGINTFDRFAKNFFQKEVQQELSVSNSIKEKERFRYIINVPELKSLYQNMAHVVNDSNFVIDTPKVKTEMVIVDANPQQERFNQLLVDFIEGENASLDEFETIIEKAFDDKQKKAASLIVSNLSLKNGIDPRLINDNYFEEPESGKIHTCCRKVAEIYWDHNDLKAVQLIFSDIGVPKSKNDKNFNVYQNIKDILVEKYNIPADEVQFANFWRASSGTKRDKELRKEFQRKVNSGEIRIAIGSTDTLGTGMNVQERAIASHDLDIPWTPAHTEQRQGRTKRQGNKLAKSHFDNTVFNYKYLAKKSLDAFRSQANETKDKFLSVFKRIGAVPRIMDEGDIDGDGNGTNYSLMKAYIMDNPQMLEIAKIEQKIENIWQQKEAIENEKIKLTREYNYCKQNIDQDSVYVTQYRQILESFDKSFSDYDSEKLQNHPPIEIIRSKEPIATEQNLNDIGKSLRLQYEAILKNAQDKNRDFFVKNADNVKIGDGYFYQVPIARVGDFILNVSIPGSVLINPNQVDINPKVSISNGINNIRINKRVNVIPKEPEVAATIIYNEISSRIPTLLKSTKESVDQYSDKLRYVSGLMQGFKDFAGEEELTSLTKKLSELKEGIELEKAAKKLNQKKIGI